MKAISWTLFLVHLLLAQTQAQFKLLNRYPSRIVSDLLRGFVVRSRCGEKRTCDECFDNGCFWWVHTLRYSRERLYVCLTNLAK